MALEVSFSHHYSVPSVSSVGRPMKAYARAFETLKRLAEKFRAWQVFVKVFATYSGLC